LEEDDLEETEDVSDDLDLEEDLEDDLDDDFVDLEESEEVSGKL
jgi:hypothetical protein